MFARKLHFCSLLFLLPLPSPSLGLLKWIYTSINLSLNSMELQREIQNTSLSLCAASCKNPGAGRPPCNAYRYGNDPSSPRLCQLGKYKRDTKNYKAGSHKTFVPLLYTPDHCFAKMTGGANYFEVDDICRRLGGFFPETRNQGQVDQLVQLLGPSGTRIGLREVSGVWRWYSDNTVSTWPEVTPGWHPTTDCGRLLNSGIFIRMICGGSGMPFTCQFC